MNVQLQSGDLLKADRLDALVNTVNCVGVMGKGIALQFKLKWPQNFREYQAACQRGDVKIGKMHVCNLGALATPRYIINFPTKQHWRGKSSLEYVRAGLVDLIEQIKDLEISSIAIPPLGAGNGGLEWSAVRDLICETFTSLPEVTVHLYEPSGAPSPSSIEVRTEKPRMTAVRAAILRLLTVYQDLGYNLTRLEVQKLIYFLGAAGRTLPQINFEKGTYGPYCDKLRHVLRAMDGHFIRGLGDGTTESEIEPVPDALVEANKVLKETDDQLLHEQVERVALLIEGFQTPYGMELLSTVHWVASNEPHARTAEDAVAAVHAWNARKKAIFSAKHVEAAWNRLHEDRWVN
ncbi:MAG: macro domain-containing protein [Rhodanobacter sp.]|jgi:O-acetyl-ADP-ribose deacetylase (regulator of RNase III)